MVTPMPSSYDAIILDLDGTLLLPDETIHPRVVDAIRDAEAAGKIVMIATGRSKISALPVIESLGLRTPISLFNGCALWCPVENRMLEERLISNRTNARLHRWAAERDAQLIVMTAGEKLALAPRTPEEARNFDGFIGVQHLPRPELLRENTIRLSFQINCTGTSSAAIAAEIQEAAAAPIYISHFPLSILPRHKTNPYSAIDVHAPCQGKAEALRYLSESKGIPAGRVIAVGDADNDIPMLQAAGLGVAMGNALSEVQAEADLVIGSHETDSLTRAFDLMLAS